jgi:hypothetical protein
MSKSTFANRAEKFRVERAKAWAEFLEISAVAGYVIEDNLANRSLFMAGYESGLETDKWFRLHPLDKADALKKSGCLM